MGIDISGLRAINVGRRFWAIDLSHTVMLGRQEIFFTKADFLFVKARSSLEFDYDKSFAVGEFSEPLLRKFGARQVDSIDASGYEGASIVADFNSPIGSSLHDKFTLFADFGTIEHIYNIPAAAENIAKLLQRNGTLLILTHANGFSGHGFYQFSPEFFYSVFSQRNGFSNTSVFLVDVKDIKRWYFVRSPVVLGRRNAIPSNKSFYIVCISSKVSSVERFTVQQSDYETMAWKGSGHRHLGEGRPSAYGWVRTFVSPIIFQNYKHRYYSLKSRREFKKQTLRFDPDTVAAEQLGRILAVDSSTEPDSGANGL